MPPPTSDRCTHELRPGTTVCLQCRRAARISGRARTQRRALQAFACAAAIGIAAAAGTGGIGGIGRGNERNDGAPAPIASALPATVDNAAPAAAGTRVASAASRRALAPTAPEGRTALRASGSYAIRTGEQVTVHFDVAKARTRRADRFEQIVRATLPEVYGPAADTLLAAVEVGTLVGAANLTADLPTRGIRLENAAGSAVTLWPETRDGRGGPLVVAYRVTATP